MSDTLTPTQRHDVLRSLVQASLSASFADEDGGILSTLSGAVTGFGQVLIMLDEEPFAPLRAIINEGEEPPSENSEGISPDYDDLLKNARAVSAFLDEHCGAEVTAVYRQGLYESARRAAHASGGGFLGLGEDTSASEQRWLDRLKADLG